MIIQIDLFTHCLVYNSGKSFLVRSEGFPSVYYNPETNSLYQAYVGDLDAYPSSHKKRICNVLHQFLSSTNRKTTQKNSLQNESPFLADGAVFVRKTEELAGRSGSKRN